jgi:hypothetical protein
MQVAVFGIDLGKNSCSIVGQDGEGGWCCAGACGGRDFSLWRSG